MIIKGVYCLTSPSGKRYVGIGMGKKGILSRWQKYKCLFEGVKKQPKLYYALKKYGPENFKYEVILETDDIDRANRVEKQLIALWNLQSNKYGYNVTAGGDSGCLGIKRSKEFCENIRQRQLNMSQETREKLRNANLGKKASEETRRKISEKLKGKTLGREMSSEAKEKMRLAAIKREKNMSPEDREKKNEFLRNLAKGIKRSEETRKRMSEAQRKRFSGHTTDCATLVK